MDQESDASLSEQLSVMQHELRTPLGHVSMAAELLANTELTDRQRALLDIIVIGIDTSLDLTRSLPHIAADSIDASVSTDLESVVRSVCALHSEAYSKKGLFLKIDAGQKLPETMVSNPTIVRQVLGNLIENARRATQKGGVTVSMALQPTDAYLSISVEDTGCGIAEPLKARLFAYGTCGPRLDELETEGNGLGLWISRRAARSIGGDVVLRNTGPSGSKFVLLLPVKSMIGLDSIGAKSPDGASNCRGVIVIDDNAASLALTSALLEALDYQAATFTDVDTALAADDLAPEPIIMLDWHMPGRSGREAIDALQARFPRARIVVCSASEPEILANCDHAPAFLQKPFSAHDLSNLLASLQSRPDLASVSGS